MSSRTDWNQLHQRLQQDIDEFMKDVKYCDDAQNEDEFFELVRLLRQAQKRADAAIGSGECGELNDRARDLERKVDQVLKI